MARFPKKPMEEIINLSVNETLSRTILTSFTTFIVVLVLFMLGGEIIHDFNLAMMIGLVVGTYSSIFVASPIVMYFDPVKANQYPLYKRLNSLLDRFRKSPAKLKKRNA
jgi:preprotein translocase subunit SecF